MDFKLNEWQVDCEADSLNTSLFGCNKTEEKVKKRKKTKLEIKQIELPAIKKHKKSKENSKKKLTRKLTFSEAVDGNSDDDNDELDSSKLSKKKKKHLKEKKRKMRKLCQKGKNSRNTVVETNETDELYDDAFFDKNQEKAKDTNISKSTMKKKKSVVVEEKCSETVANPSLHDKNAALKNRKRKNHIQLCNTPEKKKRSRKTDLTSSESKKHNNCGENEVKSKDNNSDENINDGTGSSRTRKKRKKSTKKNKYKYLDILRSISKGEVFVHSEQKSSDLGHHDIKMCGIIDSDVHGLKLLQTESKGASVTINHGEKTSRKKKKKIDSNIKSGTEMQMDSVLRHSDKKEKRISTLKSVKQKSKKSEAKKIIKNKEITSKVNLKSIQPVDVKVKKTKISKPFDAKKLKNLLTQHTFKDESEKQIVKSADKTESDVENALTEQQQLHAKKTSGRKKLKDMSLKERMTQQLKAAHFRHVNQQLYSQTGKEAFELFQEDVDAFKVYHDGFESQVDKWPSNPVKKIINQIKKSGGSLVIADFGCGDAKIAQGVPNTVHSFDLVALNKHVTECDMAKVPLRTGSVDIAVFCLSLMGTNLTEYLIEANRVLKQSAILIIAEVTSRIKDMATFVSQVEGLGFKLLSMDVDNKMFVMLDLRKVSQTKKKKVTEVELDPCVYKKR